MSTTAWETQPTQVEASWTIRNILYVADTPPGNDSPRMAAADLAMRSRAAVHVATRARGLDGPFVEAFSAYDPWSVASEVLRVESKAIEAAGGRVVSRHLGAGSNWGGIRDTALHTEADLIVVGDQDIRGVSRLLTGGTAKEGADSAHRPILVVRGAPSAWPPSHIIVGFDHSPEALLAARVVSRIAGLYQDVDIRLLEAVPRTVALESAWELEEAHMTFGDLLQSEREHLERHAEALRRDSGATISAEVVTAEAPGALLAAAAHAGDNTLLAVGTRGRGRVKRFMLGSVSHHVLHHGKITTLIVPGSAHWSSEEQDAA